MTKRRVFLFTGISVLLIAAIVLGFLFWKSSTNEGGEVRITRSSAEWSYDVFDPNQVAYDSDYIFVGIVQEEIKTVYGDSEIPDTKYSVINISNIKGNLKLNEKMEILKSGGKSQWDSKHIMLTGEDILPEVGKAYVFLGMTPFKGYDKTNAPIHISAPSFCIPIASADITTKSSAKEITQTKEYQTYLEAYKNETNPYEREGSRGERFPSIYEDANEVDALGRRANVK
jgi:hypothetical protein